MQSTSERKNPRGGASPLSIMLFWWMNDVIKLGNEQPLTEKKLFPLLEDYKAEVLVKTAGKWWLKESRSKTPRLWKAMAGLVPWKSYLIMLALQTLRSLSFVSLPVCLWLLLKTLNNASNSDMKFAFIYVAILGMTSLIQAASTQHYDYLTELWGLKLKVALIGLVYKKILALNRFSMEAMLSGNTLNLVSNDAQKIEKFLNQVGMVLFAPLELSISMVILWYLIGWEALIGAAFYFVLVVLQLFMARKAAKLRAKAAAFTDERLVVMNEIISGIRAVKMYAWEGRFRDVVSDLRRKEMAIIRLKGVIVSMVCVLFFTTLPIAALISVTALVMTGTQLSSFSIFTLLLSLMTIRTTFCYNLSMSMQMVADAKVALDRIQVFLEKKASKMKVTEQSGKNDHNEIFAEKSNPINTIIVQSRDTQKTVAIQLADYKEQDDSTGKRSETFTANSVATKTAIISSSTFPKISLRSILSNPSPQKPYISIQEMSCSWKQDGLAYSLRDITLNASRGDMIAITGAVGSGKSSLLTAILGELPLCKGKISYHGRVAYAPQIPWIFSGTIRENILFGLPFDKKKFQNVVDICGLTKDLVDFTNGDLTEIGQRGASLSGGQKARVGLARAVYSDADIYLLDDPLSAVDTKVGRKLFKSCILEFLSGRIRLLVTHQLQYLKDVDHIAVMKNGSIIYQEGCKELTESGIFSDCLELPQLSEDDPKRASSVTLNQFEEDDAIQRFSYSSVSLANEQAHKDNMSVVDVDNLKLSTHQGKESGGVSNLNEESSLHKSSVPSKCAHHQAHDLKEEEENKRAGTVTWRLYWDYFKEGLPVTMIVLVAVLMISAQACVLAPNWWLTRIAEMSYDQQKAPATQVIHACLVAVSIVVMAASCFLFYFLLLKAAENLHNKMTLTTLYAPVLFFDTNPAGRILNRFSKDVGCMDDLLPQLFLQAVIICLSSLTAMLVPAVTNYWIFLVLLPLIAILAYYARYYLKSARELQRMEALKCSPVYSHITETLNGLEIVHTSNMNSTFLERLQRYQDENTKALFMVVSCTRWLSIRLDLLSSLFVTIVAVATMLITNSPVLAGLALTYALQTLDATQYGIRLAAEVENLMTSVERVLAYTKIESEPGYNTNAVPPQSWPHEGSLAIQDLSLVYFDGGPRILKDINFCVSSKEKVGVIGRTGAGKSSLVSALLRMPDPLGKVSVDGVNVASIQLQEARKPMAVITQEPVLFGGTLKRNLDPFSQYSDHELWAALEEVQLKPLVSDLPGQLEFKLKESGTNFSVGERQLVCLARALVQKSKIIIMDEATANVDFKTDRLIQEVIRDKFKDSTVITIAHRLNTIVDYDKVLVLDGGQVVEFDKPEVLIRKGGLFAEMIRSQTQRGRGRVKMTANRPNAYISNCS